MSIVSLSKVSLYGHRDDKEAILKDLQHLGCLHIIPLVEGTGDTGIQGPSSQAREALKFLLSCRRKRRQVRDRSKFDAVAVEMLDGRIRRKLRCILWRQWKRAAARARNLLRRGLTADRAWRSATNGRGPWWNAGASHMNAAFPKSWFDSLGLVSLLDTVRRLQRAS